MRRTQRGITFLSFLIVLVVLGCIAYLAMRLIPAYTEYFSVVKALKGVAQEPGIQTMDQTSIHNLIGRRFNISYVETLDDKDVVITRNSNGMTLSVDYEVRKPVVGNVDLIVHFQNTVNVGPVNPSINAP
ncbi:MAG: DUF4845 domain-containing protein [Lysobacteraceae bacterium]